MKVLQRDSNIELLRIVLMLMIVMIHLLVRGYDLLDMVKDKYISTANTPYYLFVFTLVITSLNCFLFISGYFSISLKTKNVLSFIFQALFYSIVSFFIFFVFDKSAISPQILMKTLFPISYNCWWFLNIYLGICLLSPIINAGIKVLNRHQFILIIAILIYLQTSYIVTGVSVLSTTGHSIYSMLVMYLLGRYCRIYEVKVKFPLVKFLFLISFLYLIFYYVGILKEHQSIAWRLLTYNSVFVCIASILLFYCFKNLKIKYNLVINRLASATFGVYLFHESMAGQEIIKRIPKYLSLYVSNGMVTIFFLCFFCLFIYLSIYLLEKIRLFITTPCLNYTLHSITYFYKKLITKGV